LSVATVPAGAADAPLLAGSAVAARATIDHDGYTSEQRIGLEREPTAHASGATCDARRALSSLLAIAAGI
jgi:hypothetical protein